MDFSILYSNEAKAIDKQRQALLEAEGAVFLRFGNEEIINELENVVQ